MTATAQRRRPRLPSKVTSIEAALLKLGVPEIAVPFILKETTEYVERCKSGQPVTGAAIKERATELRRETVNYLNVLRGLPRLVVSGTFCFEESGLLPDEAHAQMCARLAELAANCQQRIKEIGPPTPDTVDNFWRYNWACRLQQVLMFSGWTFAVRTLEKNTDYWRLARIIDRLSALCIDDEYAEKQANRLIKRVFDLPG